MRSKQTTTSSAARTKKYPTGNRSNRATLKGFWKATGRDKPIYTKLGQTLIGMRKTLVFYQGRAPHGIKTDWIMHEFRLDNGPDQPAHDGGWVICRVFKKNKNQKMKIQHEGAISHEEHIGAILPEPVPRSDIPAGGGLLERSHHGVKQEIVNLDDYQPQSNQREFGLSFNKDDSIHRAIKLMKPDAANINRFSSNNDSNTGLWQIRHPQTSSSSDATEPNDYETIGGTLYNIDWSAWLQDPVQPGQGPEVLLRCPSTTKISSDDVTSPLLQLKRQNSDNFSSLCFWNDTKDFQQM